MKKRILKDLNRAIPLDFSSPLPLMNRHFFTWTQILYLQMFLFLFVLNHTIYKTFYSFFFFLLDFYVIREGITLVYFTATYV